MNGNMSFRDALSLRLNIMRPTREQFEKFIDLHPVKLTPGIARLVDALQSNGTHVYLVSGGFRRIIMKPAKLLGIPPERIYANELLFDESGEYVGFDISELTSDSGSKRVGKAGVCGLLKQTLKYKHLVMVGDGATDAEACPPADAFIGFGGNQVREAVKKSAPWFVYDFQELIDEISCPDNLKN
uniref:Phosphoserine phosphatase n=1 Tax=Acrobeloides nanus TaxID=290746 RepID=A0A914E5H7_9BILA